jgi:hypothetical protein
MTQRPSTKPEATRTPDNEAKLGDQICRALRWSPIVGDPRPG